jgi:hypothetical protein
MIAASLISTLFAGLSAAAPSVSLGALDTFYQPDGRIVGGYSCAWKGDIIYNSTGFHQKAVGGT